MSQDVPIPGTDTFIMYANLETQSKHLETQCGNIYTEARKIFEHYAGTCKGTQVVVVMEQPFNKRFAAVYAALRCVQIAVACAAHIYKFPIRYVATSQTRAALNLPAGATKAEIRERLLVKYSSAVQSLETADDNVTDAIAIAGAFAAGFSTNKSVGRIH